MIKKLSTWLPLLYVTLSAGCGKTGKNQNIAATEPQKVHEVSTPESKTTYEVFYKDAQGNKVKLEPIQGQYHGKKGKELIIEFQHTGPWQEVMGTSFWVGAVQPIKGKSCDYNEAEVEKEYKERYELLGEGRERYIIAFLKNATFSITMNSTFDSPASSPMIKASEVKNIEHRGYLVFVIGE